MQMTKRIKTYVGGLDYQLGGGVPEGSVVLLVGRPGTMKSSLAWYIMYHNALKEKVKGLYVGLEQGKESLAENMDALGMSPDNVKSHLGFIDLGLIRRQMGSRGKEGRQSVFEFLKSNIAEMRKGKDYELITIDSLPVLHLVGGFENPREEFFHFFEWLRDLKVTSILIGEMDAGSERFADYCEDFLADGIIHLDLRRDGNTVNLFLGIIKMRKTDLKRGYYPLIYDKDGFEIVTE